MKRQLSLLLYAFVCLGIQSLPGWSDEETVLFEGDSLYHHIRVSEQDGYRYLSFNRARGSQSAVKIENPFELKFAYTKAAFVIPAFLDRPPQKICLIGLGGGSIPRVMAKLYPHAKIDIVEIDAEVVRVAKEYFFFQPTAMMNIAVMDGRRFLRESRERYDLVFLDAYDDRSIPFHLTTKEFFDLVKRRLAPDGVVAANVWGPRSDKFYLSELKTYRQVFPHVYSIDAISSYNYIVVADSRPQAMTKKLLDERIPEMQKQYQFEFQLSTFASSFEDISSIPIDADILSDDFAPVENLRSQKAPSK